jgi:hypothetical protein
MISAQGCNGSNGAQRAGPAGFARTPAPDFLLFVVEDLDIARQGRQRSDGNSGLPQPVEEH